MGVPVGIDVALSPIFEPWSCDEPGWFEVGEAELTGEAVGLALGCAETFGTGADSGVDVIGEGAEVACIHGRRWCDVWLVFAAALLSRYGLLVVVAR